MKFFVINLVSSIIIPLLGLNIYAQNVKSIMSSGQDFISKGQYSHAITDFEQAKVRLEKEGNDNSINFGKVLFGILLGRIRMGDTVNAEMKFQEIETIFLADSLNTLPDQYEELKLKIDYLFLLENYKQIETLSDRLMSLEKKIYSNDTRWYQTFLNNLGNIKYQLDKAEEGESLFTAIINTKKKDTSRIQLTLLAKTYTIFADFLKQNKKLKRAEENYVEAYKIFGKLNDQNTILYIVDKLAGFYSDLNEYQKALDLYKKAASIVAQSKGIANVEYAYCTNNIGSIYLMMENFDSSQFYLEKTLSVKKNMYGTENDSYALTLLVYGRLFIKKGNYKEAEKSILKTINFFNRSSDPMSSYSLSIGLLSLAKIHEEMGEIRKSEDERLKALKIVDKRFAPSDDLVRDNMLDLATFYSRIGKFQSSDSLFKKIFFLSAHSSDSLNLADYLINYANVLKNFGKYTEASEAIIRALRINDKTLGSNSDNHFFYSLSLALIYKISNPLKYDEVILNLETQLKDDFSSINDKYLVNLMVAELASNCISKRDYSRAEVYYKKAMDILANDNNYNKAFGLYQLGTFYIEIGSIKKAEQIFLESKDILSQIKEDITIAALPLAQQYFNDNEFDKCLALYKECIQYLEKKNIQSKSLASLYIKVAELNAELDQTNEAEKNFKKGLAIFLNNGYSKTNEYFFSLTRYANFNQTIEKYDKVDSLFNKILPLYKSTENKIEYARTLFSYGIKLELRNHNKADSIFKKSIKLLVEYLGEDHPDLTFYYAPLASFYLYTSKEQGTFYLRKEFENLRKDMTRQFQYMSEQQKNAYVATTFKGVSADASFAYRDKSLWSTTSPFLYNKLLLFKNAVLNNTAFLQTLINRSKDPHVKSLWKNYLLSKNNLAQQYKIQNNKEGIKKANDNAEQLEKELIAKITGFSSLKDLFNTEWKNVQDSLKQNEAAIEFVAFPFYSRKGSDSTLYLAFVVRPEYIAPHFVYLFEEKQLSRVLKKQEGTLDQVYLNNLYQQRNDTNALYKLIWQPLDSLLEGITTVYAAPSGLLHTIALGAIPTTDGNTVSSKYGLQILGTTGDIINKKEDYINKKSIQQAILFGGINYDIASSRLTNFSSTSTNNIYAYVPTDSARGAIGKWNYLGGSLKETEQIAKEFKEQKIATRFYSDSTATETLFKNMAISSNSIIHIATHGYFFADIVRNKSDGKLQTAFKISENPLLRSGLIFAGANPSWTNADYVSSATDDGILTAYEISNMDLSNVKLVILSACETGLGDIKGSEGVFGLQRSFKLAGVKNIIMSLWKVPDEKTRELMQLFYQTCFTGKSISEAFKSAQNTMRNKYPTSPYYWAGFTLLQ